jgi:hypothetical protein
MAGVVREAGGKLKATHNVHGKRHFLRLLWRHHRFRSYRPPSLQEIINNDEANKRTEDKCCNHVTPHLSALFWIGCESFDFHP